MIGKLLNRWVNRYYRQDKEHRSVLLVHGEQNRTLVKVCGTKKNLKLNLYIAMIRNEVVRDVVLEASEWYRETGDDPMEYFKKLFELNKEESDKTDNQ